MARDCRDGAVARHEYLPAWTSLKVGAALRSPNTTRILRLPKVESFL